LSRSIINSCLVPARGVGFGVRSLVAGASRLAFALLSPLAGLLLAGVAAPSASLAGAWASATLSAPGRRRDCVGDRRGLVVLHLDPDRGHPLAGDDHPFGSAVATEHPDQAPVAEAVHNLVGGTALEREAVRQRQDHSLMVGTAEVLVDAAAMSPSCSSCSCSSESWRRSPSETGTDDQPRSEWTIMTAPMRSSARGGMG
jgi:hypothetical protein